MVTVFRKSCILFDAVHMLILFLTLISSLVSYTGRKQELGNKRKPRREDCLLFGTWNELQLCAVSYWRENFFNVSTRLCRHRRRWPRACCLFDNKIQTLNTVKQNPTKNTSGQRQVNNTLPIPKNTICMVYQNYGEGLPINFICCVL